MLGPTVLLVGLCLALAPVALAKSLPSSTWAGASTVSEEWSEAANWVKESVPSVATGAGTLTFPRLTQPECAAAEPREACYSSYNDLEGLSAESLHIDDGDEYLLEGEQLSLGSGGLTASPAPGTSGPAGDEIDMSLELSASQKWSIAGRSGGGIAENGLLMEGEVTGAGKTLTDELSNGAAFVLENRMEVGPVTITGAEAGKADAENGVVVLGQGELNSNDGKPVSLSHIFLEGSGEVGALKTTDAELDVGTGEEPAEGIEASSVTLDSASKIAFEINGNGSEPLVDYSQLLSEGSIDLGNSSVAVEVAPPAEGKPCPSLTVGQTYTFVETTRNLTGMFGNAPANGAEIPIRFAEACTPASRSMRISYHKSGQTETVTGTVEAAPVVTESPESVKVTEGSSAVFEAAASGAASVQWQVKEGAGAFEDDTSDPGNTTDTLTVEPATLSENGYEYRAVFKNDAGEEHTAAAVLTVEAKPIVAESPMKRQEEEAREKQEAEAKQRQEEEAAKVRVLSAKEGSPDAVIAGTSLQASASGAVNVKISCAAGVSGCAGTVTLRTLNAVIASSAGAAKTKAAVLTLASGSFDVPGGGSRTVTLHLSAKARALLARMHSVRVRATVVAHDPTGGTHTSQATLTLRAPQPKHRKG